MKKLILILGVIFFSTACDPSCLWICVICNNTDYIVEMSGTRDLAGPIFISSGEKQLVASGPNDCGGKWPSDPRNGDEDAMIFDGGEMKINGDVIPDAIWTRKYWEYVSEKHGGTFTLTITDELIEQILSEK